MRSFKEGVCEGQLPACASSPPCPSGAGKGPFFLVLLVVLLLLHSSSPSSIPPPPSPLISDFRAKNEPTQEEMDQNPDVATVEVALNAYVQGEGFKRSLSNLIRESYTTSIDSRIKTFDARIKDECRRSKTATEESVLNAVDTKFRTFTGFHMPGMIANEIVKQFPSYLDNNYKLQQVLKQHATDLEAKLSVAARDVMLQIAAEPQFHLMTTAHLETMQQKFDRKVIQMQHQFDQEMTKMRDALTEEMRDLRSGLMKMNDTNKKIDQMQQRWVISMSVVVTLVGIAGIASFYSRRS